MVDDQASNSFQGPVESQSSHCSMIGDNSVVRHAERLGFYPASCYLRARAGWHKSIDRD